MDFGRHLVEAREGKGVGRRELNKRSGLSLSYLHEVENDVYLPSPEKLKLIADALKLRGDARRELFRAREEAELERLGFSDTDVTLLLKETGPLNEDARQRIVEILADVRAAHKSKKK